MGLFPGPLADFPVAEPQPRPDRSPKHWKETLPQPSFGLPKTKAHLEPNEIHQ